MAAPYARHWDAHEHHLTISLSAHTHDHGLHYPAAPAVLTGPGHTTWWVATGARMRTASAAGAGGGHPPTPHRGGPVVCSVPSAQTEPSHPLAMAPIPVPSPARQGCIPADRPRDALQQWPQQALSPHHPLVTAQVQPGPPEGPAHLR